MPTEFVLRLESGAEAGQTFPISAPGVAIGRRSDADVVLNDSQVSRQHARVDLEGDRAIVTDLDSINGTFVNGQRLAAPQTLNPGDLITLGECRLRFVDPAAAAPAQDATVAYAGAAKQHADHAPREHVSIAPGTVLNQRYRLERAIGQGGFARVFLASDLALKRPIAVKVMSVEAVGEGTTEEFLARFANEAQAIANLDHAHILAVHDFDHIEETAFLVMPYVAGGTLADALRSAKALSPQVAARYLRQLASALDYAHRRNLVHRDIKPQNMLLRADDDHLLLADFGIAKLLSATSAQSRTGVVGTIAYMAPEQFQGQVSRATDIYALGCVLFQFLTGQLPFGGSTEEVIYAHLSAPVPLLASRGGAHLPPATQAVIARALAKRPEERFASAGALADAFEAALIAPAPVEGPLAATSFAATVAVAADSPAGRGMGLAASPGTQAPPQQPVTPALQGAAVLAQPAAIAKSLTFPAALVALIALLASLIPVFEIPNDYYDLLGAKLPVVPGALEVAFLAFAAIVLIRAAMIQRTDPAAAGVGRAFLRALPVLTPSIIVGALSLPEVLPDPASYLGSVMRASALALAAAGALAVPRGSGGQPTGVALANASAAALCALALALLPANFAYWKHVWDFLFEEALLIAALICFAGALVAVIVQQVGRRAFPSVMRWAWLPALALLALSLVAE